MPCNHHLQLDKRKTPAGVQHVLVAVFLRDEETSMMRLFCSVLIVSSCLLARAIRAEDAAAPVLPLPDSANVLKMMHRAADYQLNLQATNGKKSNGWVRSAFYTGVMAL